MCLGMKRSANDIVRIADIVVGAMNELNTWVRTRVAVAHLFE